MQVPHRHLVAGMALLGALVMGAWLWIGPWTEGDWSDGQRRIGADTQLRVASWDEPLPAWGGTPASVSGRATLSSDGRWLVWDGAGQGEGRDLFLCAVRDGKLGERAQLETLCTTADECAPAFAGEWLYFSSDRPGGQGGHDLWRARFASGAVLAPELVPGPANTPGEELDPAPRSTGDAIVFASDRDGSGFDLYSAPLNDGTTTRLAALCSKADEREPVFTQGDRALVFSSSRAGGHGGFDLYRSACFDADYAAPAPLEPLNSAEDERAPIAALNVLDLHFLRTENGENPVLLVSRAVELFRAPRRAIAWFEWLALLGLLALALMAFLAQKFPGLDRIYKCLLVSVVAHLLLVWWFHDLWLSIGNVAPEPERAPLHIRLEERAPNIVAAPATTPAPANETENVVAAQPVPATPLEPAVMPEPELALALPEAPSAVATESVPERFEATRPSSEALPTNAPVAAAARESSASPDRDRGELEPIPARERAVAIRDAESAPREASAAPALDIESQALGAPSATSRSMGTPSRPDRQRSLGSPAASPTSGSVAQAAESEMESARPSSSAGSADPAPRSGASVARELRELDSRGADSTAKSAAPVAALELGELAPGEARNSSPDSDAAAPQRAISTRVPREAKPDNRSAIVAQRAEENPTEARVSRTPSELDPLTQSRSRATDVDALAPSSGSTVASRASETPDLDLGALERAPAEPSCSSENSAAGPRRASNVAPSASSTPTTAQRDSLARRAEAPAAAVPRSSDATLERGPSRTDRAQVMPEDGARSVARPAEPTGSSSDSEWLPELAAQPSSSSASTSAPRSPEYSPAARDARVPEAQPRDSNAAPLARAPQPPKEDQTRPPKSDWDATPYKNREGAEKARALKLYGGSEKTEAAVARGLEYLARIQHPNGSWGDLDVLDEKYGRVAIGKTGLCTLAFLGAGHPPDSNTEHSGVVARALDFLSSVQDSTSGHFGEASAYDHGIAAYAIGESYALTKDSRLRGSLERAIAHVLAMQIHGGNDRERGGWGYYFADGSHYDPFARTSITAWQVMALESARLSGLASPDGAFEAARSFLEHAEDPRLGAYRYNHDPERLRSSYATLPASTPAALFALALLGEDISGPRHATARTYVLDRAPDGYRYSGEDDFVHLGRGNPYFWYYGTLAMFRLGGESWQRWNVALQDSLLPAQASDGSWQPLDVYARYARDNAADKSYTTSLCVLSLEVYYRYYLPLLKVR